MKKFIATFLVFISLTVVGNAQESKNTVYYFQNNDYQISSCVYSDGIITIQGKLKNNNSGKLISSKITLVGADANSPSSVKALTQTKSTTNGFFELKMNVQKGRYTIFIKGQDLPIMSMEINQCSIAQLETLMKDISNLMIQCDGKNISYDYEKCNYEIIKKYTSFLKEELSFGDNSRETYYLTTLSTLAEKTIVNLNDYIVGNKVPLSVPKYITSDMKIDGTSVKANSNMGERPTFFVGYGHWEQATTDMNYFSKVGANIIQTEIGPADIVVEGAAPYWEKINFGQKQGVSFELDQNSMKITESTGQENNKWVYIKQKIPVKPNTTYQYGLDYKGQNVQNAWFCINGLDPSGTQRKALTQGTTNWKSLSYEYTTDDKQEYLDFSIVCESYAQYLYVDNIFANEKGKTENLVLNPSFSENNSLFNSTGYTVNMANIYKLKKVLQSAKENNIKVSLNLIPHKFPQFVLDRDSTINEGGKKFFTFMPFNPTHPKVIEVMKVFINALIPQIKDYNSISDICISNEGHFDSSVSEYYIPFWQEYLKQKYTNISNLNNKYNANYQSFDEVIMPKGEEKTPLFYDWRIFNDDILASWHKQISSFIKEIAPNIPLQSKIMQYIPTYGKGRLTWSNDYEKWADSLDLNGNDGWSFYDLSWAPVQAKLAWYDLQRSIKNMPVWNTEDHIIADGANMDYNPKQSKNIQTDIWQGALHGRAGSVIWIWDRTDKYMPWGNENFFSNSNITLQPQCAIQIAKTTLDLNRLSYEVTALEKKKAEVAVLYSQNSLNNTNCYSNAFYKAYTYSLYNGQNVDFITESKPEMLNQNKYKLLILPTTSNVNEQTLQQIEKYVANGGKVVTYGIKDDCLSKNEYNEPYDLQRINNIKSKFVNKIFTMEGSFIKGDIYDFISKNIKENINNDIEIIDKATGLSVENVEWRNVDYNGKQLVSLCNYDWDNNKNVIVKYKGKEISQTKEKRSETIYSKDVLLEAYSPILLEIPAEKSTLITFDNVTQNGEMIKENIKTLQNGYIRAKCSVNADKAVLLTALYENDKIIDIKMQSKSTASNEMYCDIYVPNSEGKKYYLKSFIWDIDNLIPLNECGILS